MRVRGPAVPMIAVAVLVSATGGHGQVSAPAAAAVQPNLQHMPWLPNQLSVPAQAQGTAPLSTREPDAAYAAFQAGRYIEAFKRATDRIDRDANDAAAMTLVGELLAQGLGMKADSGRAAQWFRLANARGDAHAAFLLGMMTLRGDGVPRDVDLAMALLAQAAARGHGPASLNLALPLLAAGEPADLEKAIPLLRAAADAEIGDAQHALAVLMLEGRGLAQDIDGAADMMSRAAANGSLAGEVEFAILQFAGRGVGRDERAATLSFVRAAHRGSAVAQNRLARILIQGRWIARNTVDAMGWHLIARGQGLADPQLDTELSRLSPEERARAERFAADFLAASNLTKAAAEAQSSASEFRR